jgi:hypothetical protein
MVSLASRNSRLALGPRYRCSSVPLLTDHILLTQGCGRELQGPQHNTLHLDAEVPSREEAIEAARECLEVFAPHLLAAGPVVPIHVDRSSEGESPGENNGPYGV